MLTVKAGHIFQEYVTDNHEVVAARMGSRIYDLSAAVPADGDMEEITLHSKEGMQILRHSAAHLLAHAVTQLYDGALPNAGPPTEDGFYYDIFMDPISSDDLKQIEKRMKNLAEKNLPIVREEKSRKDLLSLFSYNKFKVDKVEENVPADGSSTVYVQDDFTDFCAGPHVPSTGYLKNVKLLSVASTHYKGDESRELMMRIYGTVQPTAKELKDYLRMREEAIKRDHRKIGREMDLFVFDSERAPGFPLYTPNGTVIRNELVGFMRELNRKHGWVEVTTPHIFRDGMWKQSGHYAKYKESMYVFTLSDGTEYAVKPMNCPGHITLFEREPHSYRDLPVKLCEPGQVYRYEKSGEVSGLTRPRTFTIDDGHGFLTVEQLVDEITDEIEMVKETFALLGDSKLEYELSVLDPDHLENYLIGYVCEDCGSALEARKAAESEMKCPSCKSSRLKPDLSRWNQASESLRQALRNSNIEFEELPGEAAFYGPKIDIHVSDAIGRRWQCSTIQVDFMLPSNFDLEYVTSSGKKEYVVMVHRAIFGSYERFMAILIESFAGKLPTWISPVQLYISPVSEKFNSYAESVADELGKNGLRVILDMGSETLNKKLKLIRAKRPSYIAVLGEREMEGGTVTVRNRNNVQKTMKVPELVEALKKEIASRSPEQMI